VDAFFHQLRGSEVATLFAISAGAALTFMRLFPNLKTAVAKKGIVSLQLAWSSARANAVIGSWRERHLDGSVKRSIYVDVLYIAGYSFAIAFLALLAGRAARASGLFSAHTADLTADFVAIGAWVAGACDCLENGGLLLLLRSTDQPVPALTSSVSTIKWLLAPTAALFSIGVLVASAVAAF
jgi:hypothetical protein